MRSRQGRGWETQRGRRDWGDRRADELDLTSLRSKQWRVSWRKTKQKRLKLNKNSAIKIKEIQHLTLKSAPKWWVVIVVLWNETFETQSRSECFACTDKEASKDRPWIKTLKCVYCNIFQREMFGHCWKDQSETDVMCSYHCLPPEHRPSGSTLIIKKRSGVNQVSSEKRALSSVLLHPKGANPSHPRWPLILPLLECAADNRPLPSLQLVSCHLSEQSPADATRLHRVDVRGI